MHELSVAEAILDHAREAAADHGANTVDTVTIALGAATHVNPDQLRFCIETVAEETSLAGVEVAIERVEPRATCDCGWAGEPPAFEGTAAVVPAARCPECGSQTDFTQGKECRLASIDIPDDAARTHQ
ncbi:hydrogenase maturation nickel metallochaperone HypA [Salinibaculum rarum]|uniref:hydrogenase maturation nickel metallochaperone HypA/HybF n=1 Tax=Salinibaculum rarum TaxID=3058903 RepID=UPI00265FE63A|nr:hydrogenase maturation nickel metallochaperone HypA [Salinibaculum sp. KK48]